MGTSIYLALGVLPDGTRDILGLWIENTEGAKFWMKVFNDLKTRGCNDILIAVTDGLKGKGEALGAVFPATGQSGIAAGSGGYDISVKGNTDLVGGAITSTAPQDQNTLKTGSITSSDLANAQTTNSENSSISLGYSGSTGTSTLLTNLRNNALSALGSGAGLPANGSQSGVTQSVISPGTVTITGTGDATKDANSKQQLASLDGQGHADKVS